MKDFVLLCKAIAGSSTGVRIRKTKMKKKSGYSFFSSNLFSQIMAGLVISLVFGIQFYSNSSLFLSSELLDFTQYFSNATNSYFIALFALSVINVMNIFFLSKNDEALVSFPITPGKIFLARMVLSLGYALLYSFIFLVTGIIYLIFVNGTALSYVNLVITFVTLPFLFISISFIVVNAIGLLVNFKKHRKVGTILTILVSIIGFVAFYLPTIFGTGESAQDLVASLEIMQQVYSQFAWIIYIPIKAILLENSTDWIYILLQVALTAGLLGLSYLFANMTYINNIGLEEGKKRKKVSSDITERRINRAFDKVSKNGMKSYVYRSVREVIHSPQIAMIYLFAPVFVALVVGTSLAFAVPEIVSLSTINPRTSSSILLAFLFGGSVIGSMTLTGSSIAVSSENKNIALIKSSPVNSKQYIFSRIALSTGVTVISSIILAVVFVTMGSISPIYIFYLLLELIPAGILFNYVNVWCDLLIPRFDWNNVSEITNNSWKPFFNMIINFVSWIVLIGISAIFVLIPNELVIIGPVTVCLIYICLIILFRYLTSKRFNKLMRSDISY